MNFIMVMKKSCGLNAVAQMLPVHLNCRIPRYTTASTRTDFLKA